MVKENKKIVETLVANKLTVRFFLTEAGTEPVRVWLKGLSVEDCKAIGADIRTVQYGWPIGMPLVDHIDGDIWEVRTKLLNTIARVLFIAEKGEMILLHGFIKKDQKTPKAEIDVARARLKTLRKLDKS